MFTRTLISPIKICITNGDCVAGAKCIASRQKFSLSNLDKQKTKFREFPLLKISEFYH